MSGHAQVLQVAVGFGGPQVKGQRPGEDGFLGQNLVGRDLQVFGMDA